MNSENHENLRDNPLSGAEFLKPEKSVESENWSRESSAYSVTRRFRQRFKELKGIVDGDDIDDAFEYGELVRASAGCVAFVLFKEGYTISIVVSRDRQTEELYTETIWPFIYDLREVKSTGALSSKQVYRIQEYVGRYSGKWKDWDEVMG